jgi:hypothetical protein
VPVLTHIEVFKDGDGKLLASATNGTSSPGHVDVDLDGVKWWNLLDPGESHWFAGQRVKLQARVDNKSFLLNKRFVIVHVAKNTKQMLLHAA